MTRIATGLIHALTQGLYNDPKSQIREMVTNSLDANATEFNIISTKSGIIFLDNGDGLDEDEFNSDFLTLGYSKSRNNRSKAGMFGIGVLSVAPSCEKLIIVSKKLDNNIIKAEMNTEKLFREENINNDLLDYLKFNFINDDVNDDNINQITKFIDEKNYKSYTAICLVNTKENMAKLRIENISINNIYREMLRELRLILPLEIDKEDLFFSKIANNDHERIEKMFFNVTNNATINLNWYSLETNKIKVLNENIKRIIYEFDIEDYYIIDWKKIDSSPIEFGGYLILNTAVIKDPWRNPAIRLNNIYICKLFNLESSNEIHAVYPKDNYISGEIFIKGLKKALKTDRALFNELDNDFKIFWSHLSEIIKPLLPKTNKKYELKNAAKKFFIDEQKQLSETIKNAISKSIEILGKDDTPTEIIEKLSTVENNIILSERKDLTDVLQDKINKKIYLYEDKNNEEKVAYYLSPKDEIKEPIVNNLGKNGDYADSFEIQVSPDFFKKKSIEIYKIGNFEIITKHGSPTDNSFEMDIKNRKIYINFFNSNLRGYSLTVFEIEIILKFAHVNTGDSKEEFYREALKLFKDGYQIEKSNKVIQSFFELRD